MKRRTQVAAGLEPPADAASAAGIWACAGVAAASIAGKEWLYRRTKDAGERAGSDVVLANAAHHRSDARVRRAELPLTNRGPAAAATWIIPWGQGRGDAAAAT